MKKKFIIGMVGVCMVSSLSADTKNIDEKEKNCKVLSDLKIEKAIKRDYAELKKMRAEYFVKCRTNTDAGALTKLNGKKD